MVRISGQVMEKTAHVVDVHYTGSFTFVMSTTARTTCGDLVTYSCAALLPEITVSHMNSSQSAGNATVNRWIQFGVWHSELRIAASRARLRPTISAPHGSTNFTDARAVTPGFLIYRIICRRCNPHSHDVVVHHFQSHTRDLNETRSAELASLGLERVHRETRDRVGENVIL